MGRNDEQESRLNKGIFAGVALLVIVAAIGAGIFLSQNVDAYVEAMIERVGTESVGTRVAVQDLELKLAEGSGRISGLTVANPQGFSADSLFRMAGIDITIDPASLTRDVYVIKSINIDGAFVLAEQVGGGTNLQALRNNMEQSQGSDTATQNSPAEDVRLAVGKVAFTNGSVALRSDVFGERTLTLPNFTLTDLGTPEKGLTPTELGEQISRQLVAQVTEAVKDELSELARDAAAEKIKEKLGEVTEEGMKKLKGLFSKGDGE